MWKVICIFLLFSPGEGSCLTETYFHLISYIAYQSPECTTVAFNLDSYDVNIISSISASPMLILKNVIPNALEENREILSARQSECVTFFTQDYDLQNHHQAIEDLLNQTRFRTVYVLNGKLETLLKWFHSHFLESVIFVDSLPSGNLKLERQLVSTTKSALWITHSKQLQALDPGITRSKIDSVTSTLKDRIVTVSSSAILPYVKYLPHEKYGGTEFEIFNAVAKKIGFNYRVKREKILRDFDAVSGKWLGILGSIANGTSEFGISVLSIQRPEGKVFCPVDFSPQIFALDHNYLATKPKPLKALGNFLRPFKPNVWISLLASLIGCSLITYFLLRYHDRRSQPMGKIILDLYSTIWTQNIKETLLSPNSTAYCLILGCWLIMMLFKAAAYNCNLRAYIVKKDYEHPIDTDEDFIRSNKDLYIADSAKTLDIFKCSNSPAKRELLDRAIERKTVILFQEGIGPLAEKMVRKGGARFSIKLRNSLVMSSFEKHFGYQPLRPGEDIIYSEAIGIAVPMYRPWAEEFNRALLRLVDSGIVEHLNRKFMPANKYSLMQMKEKEPPLEPYKIEHVLGPLILLLCGLALAGIVVCFELMDRLCKYNISPQVYLL